LIATSDFKAACRSDVDEEPNVDQPIALPAN
jgi:hypothetical protein